MLQRFAQLQPRQPPRDTLPAAWRLRKLPLSLGEEVVKRVDLSLKKRHGAERYETKEPPQKQTRRNRAAWQATCQGGKARTMTGG